MATVENPPRNLSGNSTRSVCNPWQLWLKLCRLYNRSIGNLFSGLGGLVAKYPLFVILLCFLIMGSLASGLAFMKIENRTEKLYAPQNSKSITNLDKAESYGFYRPSRNTEVILLSDAGTNVLTDQCFRDALMLHQLVTNIPGFLKLCLPISQGVHPVVSTQCVTEEPLRIFNYSSSDFKTILNKLNEPQISKNIVFDRVFGKISRDLSGRITSAKAIRLFYYMKGFSLDEDISEEITDWEKEFLNAMKGMNSTQNCGEIFYTTGRSMDDSIAESVGSDMKLIVITFTVMISFACFMLGKYLNPLTGHGLLAMSGVLSVVFGIMAGFGLSMLAQTPYVSIVGIVPFLIIGVGIDDMFIIVDELDRVHPDQTIPKRLGTVMCRVGPAITMTTMTDLLAFAVGTTSIFPSVVYFCTYAALAIVFAFFFLVTIFVAFMTYDCKRMNAGRSDMVPCLRVPASRMGNRRWDEPQTSNKIMTLWGKLLMKPVVKGLVIIVSTCLFGIGIYGTTFINEEFDRRDLAKDGSEFIKFLDTSEAYFIEDIKVDIVLEPGVNYSDFYTQQKILNISNIVKDNRFYRPIMVSWLTEFLKNSASKVSTNSSTFLPSLQAFLESHPKFRSDVVFSTDNSSIVSSRLYCFIKQSTSSVALRDAMITLRDDLSKKSDLPVFASGYMFIFYEQFVATLPETIRNLVLAAVAILVATSLFLVNPIVVFLVLFGFVSLIFELLGLMYIWGVSLNSISMINLVMAIGFAVDYSAHFAHAFVFSRETIPEEKVIQALGNVGASVFMGGFSTFLGMVVTGFSSSQIFRIFFKMFFGIVVLGLLHGLCFLPVWLTIFCRHHIEVGIEEQSVSHNPKTTMSALDNPAISTISENHEKSVCNPVMNSNGTLAGITASGTLDTSNNKIPLSNLQTNSHDQMSGSESSEIQPNGEQSTSCPEFDTDGPTQGRKIDRTSSKTAGDHENSRFNSVINSDKMPVD